MFAGAVLLSAPACVTAADDQTTTVGVQSAHRSTMSVEKCAGEDENTAGARSSIARIRAMAGLPALRCDASASIAATRHCQYVVANKQLTHEETPGKPAFFAERFDQRLAKQGFVDRANAEVLTSLSGASALDDPRGLVNSVYHRAPFLRVENISFGYGHGDNCATIDFGRQVGKSAASVLVVWPPDGATNVPRAFRADRETPNPLPGSTNIGSPVSLLGADPGLTFGAQMTGPDGRVDVVLRTAEDDSAHLVRKGEVHVMPRAPLAANADYTVHFVGVLPDGRTALDVSTTFTTGGN